MAATLDIRHESLAYTARFARPPFALWGAGGRIVGGIYEALTPYNVTLQNIHLSPSVSSPADVIVTVQLGATVLRFSYEKIEVTFSRFSEEEFRGIPKFLHLSTSWLGKDFPFASHQSFYYSHSFLREMTVDDFLRTMTTKTVKSAGIDLGSGVIFHRAIPQKSWITQLTVDKSQGIPGALFIGLNVSVTGGTLDYDSLFADGREYFGNALAELGLILPELTEQK